ncbi:uncharacterized protein K452DRAFT_40363 [Aplosporella prunicola CBS 121167]|uniref:Uncharacterized protein n=1 Tax=Aplosporella prunicola CBS 121167 TaxID=1176127 RepID=A0A6A6BBL6_9PEZI|nr:uncharacterized protein K452DRAFT_40363 [Aplosporella prunicola CBS 121167]KAF2141510.1 hypothetical protein K452DRAFT_40363 [Aplosporella prunicola CBS 121167]
MEGPRNGSADAWPGEQRHASCAAHLPRGARCCRTMVWPRLGNGNLDHSFFVFFFFFSVGQSFPGRDGGVRGARGARRRRPILARHVQALSVEPVSRERAVPDYRDSRTQWAGRLLLPLAPMQPASLAGHSGRETTPAARREEARALTLLNCTLRHPARPALVSCLAVCHLSAAVCQPAALRQRHQHGHQQQQRQQSAPSCHLSGRRATTHTYYNRCLNIIWRCAAPSDQPASPAAARATRQPLRSVEPIRCANIGRR